LILTYLLNLLPDPSLQIHAADVVYPRRLGGLPFWHDINETKHYDDYAAVRTTTLGLQLGELCFSGKLFRRFLLASKTTFESRVLTWLDRNFLLNTTLHTDTHPHVSQLQISL